MRAEYPPVELWIPHMPPGLNGKDGLIRMSHWRQTALKSKWRGWMSEAARPMKLSLPVRVTMTRHYARVPMDLDNASASLKFPMDAMRHVGILPEDNPLVVSAIEVKQLKVARVVDQGILIRLEPDMEARA